MVFSGGHAAPGYHKRSVPIMDTSCCGVRIGHAVPEFKLDTFDPLRGDFGAFSLAEQIKNKKWTILFFYPADFTFV